MDFINTILPLSSSLISFIFAIFIFKRYFENKRLHLLLWGIGMVFYGMGGLMEAIHGLNGWNEFVFRTWYVFGAILVAAWLGQGSIYLLAKRKWAHIAMAILLIGSIVATYYTYTFPIEAPTDALAELSGKAIFPEPSEAFSPRLVTPFFNFYGTLGLVGGAVYSAWIFFRKRVLLHRVIGNVLIALGGLSPAIGGSMSRVGTEGALYISEFIGAVLMFIGFWRATTEMGEKTEE